MSEKQIEVRITGAQGSGKTTLANMISRMLIDFDKAVFIITDENAPLSDAEVDEVSSADVVIVVGGAA